MARRPSLNGFRVKSPGSTSIYLVDKGSKRHIPDPATYNNLFDSWSDVIEDPSIDDIDLGPPISPGASLMQAHGDTAVYFVEPTCRRWVTSPATMERYRFAWARIQTVSPDILGSIPEGSPIRWPETTSNFTELSPATSATRELHSDQARAKGSSTVQSLTILFLGANPSDTTRLALQKEAQEIDNRLRATDLRAAFKVEQQWEVRPAELPGKIMRFRPQILHFSGHGDSRGELVFQDRDGAAPAKQQVITRLFSLLGQDIKCVVLNACYSASQADAISQHVDAVIGMSQAIGDADAISFAGAFYEALGYGKDLQTAFELAKLGIDLDRLPDGAVPQLLIRAGVDPRQLVLAKHAYGGRVSGGRVGS
ncbi:CHAT domain-containing protein [Accumulibacter sp.]|uniref:CHAT domain-containing protein n=1 Tax=Accumulibacter sp. TaxID=2053492 RepID=UPI003390131A